MVTASEIDSVYMRQREAAVYLRVCSATLRRLARAGLGPAHSKRGRCVLYARADLDRWVADGLRGGIQNT